LLGPLIRLLCSKRFVDWSFGHYLRIAPPPPSSGSADDEQRAGKEQGDAEQTLGRERDLVEAE
jgi:hypothetical protein